MRPADIGRRSLALAVALVVVAAAGPASSGGARRTVSPVAAEPVVPRRVTPPDALVGWSLTSVTLVPSARGDQGVATLVTATGRQVVVTRGLGDIPAALARAGWVHLGHPGGWGSYLVDAYQAAAGARTKMFLVTAPGGGAVELVHVLAPGEMVNNSFAAVSPDGRWLVSGEWRTVHRFLVFALPRLTPMLHDAPLALSSTIALIHPLRDVQGCSFDGPGALVCTTDDPGRDLFPVSRQVVRVELSHPLDGWATSGRPTLVGAVPTESPCAGHGEPEGVDITDGVLRFTVVEPGRCRGSTRLFTFGRSRA